MSVVPPHTPHFNVEKMLSPQLLPKMSLGGPPPGRNLFRNNIEMGGVGGMGANDVTDADKDTRPHINGDSARHHPHSDCRISSVHCVWTLHAALNNLVIHIHTLCSICVCACGTAVA